MRTRWPLMVLLFVIPGSALTYCSPDLISSAPAPAEPVVQLAVPTSAAAAAVPQDGWPLPYNGKKFATVSVDVPQATLVDEPATDTHASASAPAASSPAPSQCRKYLRTLHLPKDAPKAKAVGLLEQASNIDKSDNARSAKVDPNKALAILNQRILKADDCLKRAGPGS